MEPNSPEFSGIISGQSTAPSTTKSSTMLTFEQKKDKIRMTIAAQILAGLAASNYVYVSTNEDSISKALALTDLLLEKLAQEPSE